MATIFNHFAQTWDTLKELDSCDSKSKVEKAVLKALAPYGYRNVLFMAAATKLNRNSDVERMLLCNWPKQWFEQYHRDGFINHDPIVTTSHAVSRSFRWSEAPARSHLSKRVMETASDDYRLKYGICIPIRNFEGLYAACSFADEEVDESDNSKFAAELIAIYAFNRLANLDCSTARRLLTDRQREIMKWVAAGKTSWDTSVILNISESTVKKTIDNAMQRLDVRTRAQAIAEAIRRGEIAP